MKNAICDKYKQEHCFLYILNTSLSDFESLFVTLSILSLLLSETVERQYP